jgi:hypothetical protein
MAKIVITQKNVDGKGNDRIFTHWPKRGQAEITARRLGRAYNLDHTTIEIIND